MEEQPTAAVPPPTPEAVVSRRAVLRIGAVVGCGALFALTACGIGGGGDDEDDEDDEEDD